MALDTSLDSADTTESIASRGQLSDRFDNNISRNLENASNTDGVRHSIATEESKPYYDILFADSVDAVLNKENIGHGLIFVRNTPEALLYLEQIKKLLQNSH